MEKITSIDISALFGADETARDTVDAQIVEAIRSHGGFVIAGFPRADEIDALAGRMVRFFDLSEAEKFKVAKACSSPGAANKYRGYECNLKPGGRFAFNEMFDIGPKSPSPARTEGTKLFAEANVWPEQEPSPGWRQAMEDYHETLHLVAMAVLHSIGRSVGLSAEKLDRLFRTGNSTLRLINYPLPPEDLTIGTQQDDDGELQISTAAHTDGSGLSILWSLQPGLQARSPDGTWREVPQQANCLSIHLGDVIEAITGGRIPATPHRVVGHGIARQSVGFFLEPRLDRPLGIAETTGTEVDFPQTYGWLLQKRFSGYEDYKGSPRDQAQISAAAPSKSNASSPSLALRAFVPCDGPPDPRIRFADWSSPKPGSDLREAVELGADMSLQNLLHQRRLHLASVPERRGQLRGHQRGQPLLHRREIVPGLRDRDVVEVDHRAPQASSTRPRSARVIAV